MSRSSDALARASIIEVGGPVLHAQTDDGFTLNESVLVGPQQLMGEVLRLDGEQITVQVFEDTTGLKPGDPIVGTGQPLSVILGPGLLGGIFDGLLRPLTGVEGAFIEPGLSGRSTATCRFEPEVEPGQTMSGGQILGRIVSDGVIDERALAPVDAEGEIIDVVESGELASDAVICRIRQADGSRRSLSMQQRWPVRQPRPVAERLPGDTPLITGQRIVDSLFPVARGGRAALPGGFGTGKTILQQSIAKWCDADVIIYVGCGERGNEMAEVLREFPELNDPRTGRRLSERSVIIANTSNMPVAAREASIYAGVTVAEYFRDQGLDVAMLADSTSRWAEALREISGRLGELPAEAGYPAYLGSRKAEFYERAGRVTNLAGSNGSVTLVGAVSPPGGDFSEPVTLYTQRNVRCFWPLDRDRARARFYPAIHPLNAYSEDAEELGGWWRTQGAPRWHEYRRRLLELLEAQVQLERMARIVGKDTLPASQRLTLLNAELANEAFLRQSAMSDVDAYCAPSRQLAMLDTLMRFIDQAEAALDRGASIEAIQRLPILRRLRRMGEEIGNDAVEQFETLHTAIDAALAELEGTPQAPVEETADED